MKFGILHEIKRMELKYREKYICRGEVICLDVEAEVRLAVHIVDSYHRFPDIYVNHQKLVDEILEYGIRGGHLSGIKISGMRVKFDCPSFCIELPEDVIEKQIDSMISEQDAQQQQQQQQHGKWTWGVPWG